MALDRVRTSLDGLPEDVKKEYKKVGEEYVLDVTGDDNTALLNAKNHEKEARKQAEARARELQTRLDESNEALDNMRRGAIPKADVEGLENSWRTKVEQATKAGKERETALQSHIDQLLCDNVATTIAHKISTAPELILPHIRARLQSAEVDGKMVTRVKDANGQLSALTVDDLEKEISNDGRFASVIIGSKASGAGGEGGGKGNGGGGGGPKKLSEMNDKERTDLYKTDPEKFRKLVAEAQKR